MNQRDRDAANARWRQDVRDRDTRTFRAHWWLVSLIRRLLGLDRPR